jgi:hypothetical protein
MKEKSKNMKEVHNQIENIDARMKNVNKELDYIHKISQDLILEIKEKIKKHNEQYKK